MLRRFLPKGLFARSLIIIVAPMVLLQAVVAYVFFDRHYDRVTNRLARGVAGDVALLIDAYDTIPAETQADREAVEAVLNRLSLRHLELRPSVLEDKDLPATGAASIFSIVDRGLSDELEKRVGRPHWVNAEFSDEFVELRIDVGDHVLRFLAPRNRVTSSTGHIFIMWMIGTSLVFLAIAILFLRNQVRPIRLLAEAADGFGKGRDVPRFKPSGAREVRRAAAAFIGMRDRIRRHIQQRTEMLAGVSHDLRTPLTRMKLQLAMLPPSEAVDDMKTDLNEMERMLKEYLDFARGQGSEKVADTDIADLISEVADDARRNGAAIEVDMHGMLTVPVRRNAIKRCVTNLVENAQSHARHVWLDAVRHDGVVEISIDDDGPGIPAERREEAFRPFHRLDEARNLDKVGVGLGLAIARDIARGHGGDIHLGDSPHGGLRVIVRVPV